MRSLPALLAVVGLACAASWADAQQTVATSCTPLPGVVVTGCEDFPPSVCTDEGFKVTLVSFELDQNAGTSRWVYEVCAFPQSETRPEGCPLSGLFQDLSHINFNFAALGSCLNEDATVTVTPVPVAGPVCELSPATFSCSVGPTDPSCDPPVLRQPENRFVAKCDVEDDSFTEGECAHFELAVTGALSTFGPGEATTTSKAGPTCSGPEVMLGPSCQSCAVPEACLTRTPGFWGTHPHITDDFLPVTVCGVALDHAAVGTGADCTSVTEALCVAPGRESRDNPAYASLVRALAAAKLNQAASAANGGSCAGGLASALASAGCPHSTFGAIETALCAESHQVIASSQCIEGLAAFNESEDTFPTTPPPFDQPGPANPSHCQVANGDGIVIGRGVCAPRPPLR